MSKVKYGLEISPIPGGIKLFLFWLSWILNESPRVFNQFSFLLLDHIGFYGCTVVQDQCSIVALYCCITCLPVYPSTIHGHCSVVLLDTSNSSTLHCTTLKVQTVYCTRLPNWALRVLYTVSVDVCLHEPTSDSRGKTSSTCVRWSS
jgi:hypothetical protein